MKNSNFSSKSYHRLNKSHGGIALLVMILRQFIRVTFQSKLSHSSPNLQFLPSDIKLSFELIMLKV